VVLKRGLGRSREEKKDMPERVGFGNESIKRSKNLFCSSLVMTASNVFNEQAEAHRSFVSTWLVVVAPEPTPMFVR